MKRHETSEQLTIDSLANLAIDEVDSRLRQWAAGVLDNRVEVFLTPPGASPNTPGVHLYLMQLTPVPPLRNAKRPPAQLKLCYLVTAHSSKPADAHRWLSALVFAALSAPELEVSETPVPVELWPALGAIPQPAFMLCVPLRHDPPALDTPRVRHPIVLQTGELLELYGCVLGPKDIPLPDVRVEMPDFGLTGYTDTQGRFRFSYIAANTAAIRLRITVKGRVLDMAVAHGTYTAEAAPFVIRFVSFE